MIPRLFATALLVVLLGDAGLAAAEARRVVSRASDIDVGALTRLTRRGEVALIETTPEGRCRQVVMFAILDAPPAKVWDVLMDVEAYPEFLRTVVDIDITGRKNGITAFTWELDVPFFTLKGERLQRGRRPRLVEVRGLRGNLRGTRERWELYPIEGGKRTLAALYRSLDLETGGFLLETMIDLEPSMASGVTLSTGFVHMRGLSAHLAGDEPPEPKARTGAVPPFSSLKVGEGDLALERLNPLLRHGQLALIESHPDGALEQVALMSVVEAPKEKLQGVVQDPGSYPEFIPNFAKQDVTRLEDGRLEMEWEIEVPLVNLEGTSHMTIEDDGDVDVLADSGDITRGRWRWEFVALDEDTTIPIHYAYSDVRESSWVTRKIVGRQPLFEHGIVIASTTVAMTAMKARAEGRR